MAKITEIIGRSIFDSRGYPTVEVDVYLADGSFGRASVPSGASTGKREALELRDGKSAYGGNGVERAVENVNGIIAGAFVGHEAWDQFALDKAMCQLDGTQEKSNLGANAILGVSLAVAKAAAASEGKPLYRHIADIAKTEPATMPLPMMNILNGGKHADSSLDIQECMVMPLGAKNLQSALRMGSETFHSLGSLLKEAGYSTAVGDEGGFAPKLKGGFVEALDFIVKAIVEAGYKPGHDVAIGIDVAASELINGKRYEFNREGRSFESGDLTDWYEQILRHYPVVSIEDGLGEDDWQGWRHLTARLGGKLQLVGDDLFVTNARNIQQGISQGVANATLIKLNQIGTLTETIIAVQVAQKAGWRTIISHRSGETEDTTIAHLAVGLNAGQIKSGSMSRSERTAKYNELLRIAEKTGLPLAKPFS